MQKKIWKKESARQPNTGFSMITVIIAVAFAGIMALLVIYLAMANFQMKMTGLKSTDSFYTAEQALEEIRTGLQEDVAEAMSTAYTEVMEKYNQNVNDTDESMDVQRQNAYKTYFVNDLKERLKNSTDSTQYDMEKLRAYVDLDKKDSFDKDAESLVVTNPEGSAPIMNSSNTKGILLKNLKVIYVDAKGHASVIETDIRLSIPPLQFPTPSTLPDLMNMIVVANRGIVCEGGNLTKENQIEGSVYAGLLPENLGHATATSGIGKLSKNSILLKSGANLELSKGDRVVCQGKVSLQSQSEFSSGKEVTLWARGVDVTSAEVHLTGTTYLADDLTVEKGESSNVELSGEYYGYGNPDSAKASKNSAAYESEKSADLSSAIVINGKNTTLNLSGLEKLMLAGKSYISSSALPSKVTDANKNENDVITGESLTVKGTQAAYLLPASLLGADTDTASYQNPMSYSDYNAMMKAMNNQLQIKKNTQVAAFGNRTLSEIGVDADKPVQTVFYNDNTAKGGGFVYFYLNFTSDEKAAEFMQNYYSNNPTMKAAMDGYLSFYFNEDSGISLKDPTAYLRYVTNGNTLSYDGKTKNGKLDEASDATVSQKLKEEQTSYQNMWYALNRKMIGSYDLLKTEVKEDNEKNGITHDETDANRSVFDNLVNEKAMVQFVEKQDSTNKTYTFTASEEDGALQAIMAHNGISSSFQVMENGKKVSKTISGTNKTLVIDEEKAKKLRLVVCTGNVEISENVEFYGIIMAGGTITLKEGAKLVSSPLEAAKVFQAQVNNDNVSPQDFFWEGDKYVLGNSSSGDSEEDDKNRDVYQAKDYVGYENWKKK